MPIDRMLWKLPITANHVPAWPCPGCRAPSLDVVSESFRTVPDRESYYISDRKYHPCVLTGRFICLLQCSRCRETCAVSGNYDINEEIDDKGTYEYEETGHPTSITPPPPMIQIPEDCPEPIERELRAAFSAFWSDHASSLNHVRQAIELLLNDLGIPRKTLNKSRKRVPHALHRRIELLKTRKPKLAETCERMLAVKHLGNAGSHSEDVVTVADVFDGFDILERVLYDTYSDHDSVLAKRVGQINRRKGPRKPRRRTQQRR